ncbi:SphA family protein [Acinetobacter pragensis]|uniref:Phenol degradation protein meta n=1 Tax=Acinetobacter pragensis TaxID=1806892 RepID=A0A151Y3X1_9GAMM|nr:transporter [Acinetobacter pragensis]KYQ72732.1 hypothetical protein AZH43_07695 [Acinetobacter pragensis]
MKKFLENGHKKTIFTRNQLKLACMGSLIFGIAPHVFAVENGGAITPPGIYDFGSGMTPPPSEYGALGIRFVNVQATTLKDNDGNKSAVKPDFDFNAIVFAGLKMTDLDFLGGKYGFAAVVPMIDISMDLSIPTPVGNIEQSGRSTALGDIQIIPMVVQWNPTENLWLKTEMMFQLPTGSYDPDRVINTGVNHWTFQPSLSMTYMSPTGFEISTSSQVNFNTRNKDTDYRSGTEFQQDFGVGQHIGNWIFGIGGYVYKQLTDDKSETLTNGNRGQAIALGPAIGYVNFRNPIPTIYFHAYKEFDAQNKTEGTNIALRLGMSF